MINRDENPIFLNDFLDYSSTILNKSPNTMKEYNYDINHFLKFIKYKFNMAKMDPETGLSNIKINDINKEQRKIKIFGKGSKERYVLYGDYASDVLDKYLKDIYPSLRKQGDYLILNSHGGKITTRGVAYLLDEMIKKTSIHKNISPHMLRHTFATHLLNEGCDILSVQELLGHESLSSTQVYTHVSKERLKEVYEKAFPRR